MLHIKDIISTNIRMSLSESKITIKDFIQWVLLIITATGLFISLSSKVDNLTEKVESIVVTTDKRDEKREVYDKAIQNQVSTTTLQVELLKQEFKQFKETYKK